MQDVWTRVRACDAARLAAAMLATALLAAAGCGGSDDSAGDPADAGEGEHDAAGPGVTGDAGGDETLPGSHEIAVEVVTEGLAHPWGMAFLPDGDVLVTERPGRLQRVDLESGDTTEISGVPAVVAAGQGGLLDVALHPAFEDNGLVYLSYAGGPQGGGNGAATHLGRGQLEGDALVDFEAIFVAEPFSTAGQHFGSRIVFDGDGYVYLSIGDRGDRDQAQDTSNAIGSIVRLHDDGEVPSDNPFVGEEGFEPAIFSYGHRNPQGMTIEPATGRLWEHEHGPSGGDEINLPAAGENFGWPITSYGTEYGSGQPIGPDPHDYDDAEPPIHWWEDSFAPSGMTFYEGDVFPEWRGDLFLGSLVRRHLARLRFDGTTFVEKENFLIDDGHRVRDVRVGPDGYLYVLVDANDAPLLRLVPADDS
jgi:aldose sugar dehydrogenase